MLSQLLDASVAVVPVFFVSIFVAFFFRSEFTTFNLCNTMKRKKNLHIDIRSICIVEVHNKIDSPWMLNNAFLPYIPLLVACVISLLVYLRSFNNMN